MKKKLLIVSLFLAVLACGIFFLSRPKQDWGFDGNYDLSFHEVVSFGYGGLGEIAPKDAISVLYSYGFGVYEKPSQEKVAFRKEADAFLTSFRYCKGSNPSKLPPPEGGIEITFADGCSPYRVYWAEGILWVPYDGWEPYQPNDPKAFDRQLDQLVELYNENNP